MRPYTMILAAGICLVSWASSPSIASGHKDRSAPMSGTVSVAGSGIDARGLRPSPAPVEVVVEDEVCDGLDQDGDGEIDEGLTRPCTNACGGGTETCVAGEWLSCSARPCCDITVGPGLPTSTLCPAAQTEPATVCLLPGTYSVDAGCQVRSSLIGLGDPATIVIEGDLTLFGRPARIQGITITGTLRAVHAVDLLENRVLGGVQINGNDPDPPPAVLRQASHNEIHGGITVGFDYVVHANEITPSLGLSADYALRQFATENHIVGPGIFGLQVSPLLVVYLAGNVIEDVDTGIQIACYGKEARIVGNRIVAHSIGVDACDQGGAGGVSLLRNDISYGGMSGAIVRSDALRIEGNLIVRDPGASPSPDSGGILARLLPPDGCSPCQASLRDNTIVGAALLGMVVDHEIGTSPAVVAGNVIVGSTDAGVLVCSQDGCPSSPPFAITATSNDVQAGGAIWSGTSDPTGTNGNISADPLFVDPGAGDFRLAEGSPCRDAGTPGNLLVDLLGQPRSLDGDADGTAVPDMGALEAGGSCRDEDGDGFGAPGNPECPAGTETDCDDTNPDVFPGGIDLPGNSVNESCGDSPAACDPDRPEGWRNHGQYVSCVARAVGSLIDQDLITSAEGDALIRAAARSKVGK